jgi:hypothetical protein
MNEILSYRQCSICNSWKSPTEYYKNKERADGLDPYCKNCRKEKTAKWRGENPKRAAEYHKRWRAKQPKQPKKIRQPKPKLPKPVRTPKPKPIKSPKSPKIKLSPDEIKRQVRHSQIKKVFGISLVEYEQRRTKANGRCAVCGTETKKLHLDHDHATGKLRDFLCHRCNLALGLVNDNISRLSSLIDYLKLHV